MLEIEFLYFIWKEIYFGLLNDAIRTQWNIYSKHLFSLIMIIFLNIVVLVENIMVSKYFNLLKNFMTIECYLLRVIINFHLVKFWKMSVGAPSLFTIRITLRNQTQFGLRIFTSSWDTWLVSFYNGIFRFTCTTKVSLISSSKMDQVKTESITTVIILQYMRLF